MLQTLNKHRDLILQLIKREVSQRYRGSNMGMIWSFIHPVLMLLVYMFVFGMVLNMKWGIEGRDTVQFGVLMFSGIILHGFLGECLTRGVALVTGNPQYVKKVVFPLEALSVISIGTALFHLFAGFIILIGFAMLTGTMPSWTILLTPVVLLPFIIFMLGCSWLLSALCVFVRDIAQVMGVLVTILLFMAPIVYPLNAVPEKLQIWMLVLNPLTVIVEELRAVALFGQLPNWLHLGIYTVVALLVLFIGYWFFNKTRGAFADAI